METDRAECQNPIEQVPPNLEKQTQHLRTNRSRPIGCGTALMWGHVTISLSFLLIHWEPFPGTRSLGRDAVLMNIQDNVLRAMS